MLKKINAGRVESNEGFSIHIIGLETLEYDENGKYIVLDWTFDPKTQKTRIYVSDIKAWDSHGQKLLSSEEKERISHNIKRAVRLLDGNFEIV